jgi:hypothetical protein
MREFILLMLIPIIPCSLIIIGIWYDVRREKNKYHNNQTTKTIQL